MLEQDAERENTKETSASDYRGQLHEKIRGPVLHSTERIIMSVMALEPREKQNMCNLSLNHLWH